MSQLATDDFKTPVIKISDHLNHRFLTKVAQIKIFSRTSQQSLRLLELPDHAQQVNRQDKILAFLFPDQIIKIAQPAVLIFLRE